MPGKAGGKLPRCPSPRGLVAASRICCFKILEALRMAEPFTDMLVDESGVIAKKPGSVWGL